MPVWRLAQQAFLRRQPYHRRLSRRAVAASVLRCAHRCVHPAIQTAALSPGKESGMNAPERQQPVERPTQGVTDQGRADPTATDQTAEAGKFFRYMADY